MSHNRAPMEAGPIPGRRLPISLKVLLAAGGLLGLLAGSMIVAILLVMDLTHDRAHSSDRDLRYVNAVATAALEAKGVANDQRGFLLTGDPKFLQEADQRTGAARAAFVEASRNAADGDLRSAVSRASIGFERWVAALRGEIGRFEAGDRRTAISASMGADRTLRKTYERALDEAQSLGASSIRSSRSSAAAASSRSVRILLACSLTALVIGCVVAVWLVRSIAMPVSRLTAILRRADIPSRGPA